MKQVVGKRINKTRYLYPLQVSLPGGVDGLYTLQASHAKKVAIATSRNLIPKNSVLTGENLIVDNNKNIYISLKLVFWNKSTGSGCGCLFCSVLTSSFLEHRRLSQFRWAKAKDDIGFGLSLIIYSMRHECD